MSDTWMPGMPGPSIGSPIQRIEDALCRRALSLVNISPGQAIAAALGPGKNCNYITFQMLRSGLQFPASPGIADIPGGEHCMPTDMVLSFKKSKLWQAWNQTWEAGLPSKEVPVMAFRAPPMWGHGWTYAVAYHGVAPMRPHFCLGHQVGLVLIVEPFNGWVRGLDWNPVL